MTSDDVDTESGVVAAAAVVVERPWRWWCLTRNYVWCFAFVIPTCHHKEAQALFSKTDSIPVWPSKRYSWWSFSETSQSHRPDACSAHFSPWRLLMSRFHDSPPRFAKLPLTFSLLILRICTWLVLQLTTFVGPCY
jgi:hypothetical protein